MGNGEIPTESHLGQEKVHGVAGFQAKGAEDFFRRFEMVAVNPGP